MHGVFAAPNAHRVTLDLQGTLVMGETLYSPVCSQESIMSDHL